ncbi:MAG TPA: hypothetical protein VIU41_04535 [Geobacteraceae bacterium]
MTALYPLLIIVGLAMVGWGLPAAHRWRPPFNILAALAIVAGLLAAMLGVLLTAVPTFFQG